MKPAATRLGILLLLAAAAPRGAAAVAAAADASGGSILSPGLSAEQAAQLAGFWRYQNRTQGTYNFFGSIWDEMMAGAAANRPDAINVTQVLAEALEATSFLIQGGILIPAVHPASGVFGGYFVTEGISPPPSGSQLPPDFPLVSRLVGKAQPGQGPNLLTWQGFYSNTSSLLQGVVQAAGDGQLVMDFLSTGGLAIKGGRPVDNQHACEYFLEKDDSVDVEGMLASLAPKLPVSLDGGI